MKYCANEPYNILYTETVPGEHPKFKVGLTKMPIADTGKLESTIEIHPIEGLDVVAEDVGFCDDERVVYELFKPNLTIVGQDDKWPIWFVAPGMLNIDEAALARHGACMMEFRTNFAKVNLDPADPSEQSFIDEAASRSLVLWARVKDNHKLESGTFTTHLSPRIRNGQGILHGEHQKEYFVEQVDHQVNFGEHPVALTTLAVTRGQSV